MILALFQIASYTEEIPDTGVKFDMVAVGDVWIGKTEVTWDEFEQFFYADEPPEGVDAISLPSNPYEPHDHGWGTGKRPAVGLSKKSAEMYCAWLSWKTGKKYRLPTETEWEKARGDAPASYDEVAWHPGNSGGKTQPVAQKKPNAHGLYDMFGNAMEYCSDAFEDKKDPFDPELPMPALRGGSYADAPGDERRPVDFKWNERDPNRPRSTWWLYDGPMVGFRLARSP